MVQGKAISTAGKRRAVVSCFRVHLKQ